MFSVPLFIILAAYGLFLILFFLISYANAYHLYTTGTFTRPALLVTAIVSTWCLLILVFTALQLSSISLTTKILFFGPAGIVTFEEPNAYAP